MKPHTSGVFKSHCAAVASNFVPLAALVFWYALVRMPDSVMSDPLCNRHEPVVGGGGGVVTVTFAVPLFPSLVAVIVAVPAATPVTRPFAETVAALALLVAQLMLRPLSAVPLASLGVAVSCTVAATSSAGAAGLTLTDPTGTGVTVTVAVPLFPSLVAVIVAVPATTPVTSPLVETLATVEALDAHVTVRPGSEFPTESCGVAVNWTVPPTARLGVAGFTATEATGTATAVTVTVAVPLFPSLVAVIIAPPTATPVTRPVADTVATPPLLVAHVTVRPLSGFPLASRSTAVSCAVPPMTTLGAPGLTLTAATGATVTVTAAVPFFPSLVAVIVAAPGTMPVKSPVLLTVATTVLPLAQVTARPLSTLPAESAVLAESCSSWPTSTLAGAGATVTIDTGTGVTRTTAVSATPPWFPLATTFTVPVSALAL